jgi:hypothetical protein
MLHRGYLSCHRGCRIPGLAPVRRAASARPSFCYVEDLIRGMIALAESGHHDPVNIGNPDEFTSLELAETIKELTGSSSEIVHEALPTDDPKQRRPVTRPVHRAFAPPMAPHGSMARGRARAAVSPYRTPRAQDSRPASRAPSAASAVRGRGRSRAWPALRLPSPSQNPVATRA